MTTNPEVSIILAVYNGEKFVAAAIQSVLYQTFQAWELLAIDDGSTDATPERLGCFAHEPRLRVRRQTNRRLAASRNHGLSLATGRYVAFLDADDLWRPDYLAKMVAALDNRPEAALAFAGWQYVNADGVPLPQSIVVTPTQVDQLRADLDRRNVLVPAGVVARRGIVDAAGGFDESLHICADWDMWLRLRPLGDFVALPEVLVWYRTHGENMSDDIEGIESERRRVLEKHFGPADLSVAGSQRHREAVAYALLLSALAYLRVRNRDTAANRLRQALGLWPGLLDEREFFYELACANQPRGFRGSRAGLELQANAAFMRELVFEVLDMPPGQRPTSLWGNACLVLAQLAYHVGDRPASRRFARQAARHAAWRRKPAAVRALLRASLPDGAAQALRRVVGRRG